jgi:Zn-dependent protease
MKGAFPLFKLAGIQVYLHFTWFIVALIEFSQFSRRYHSPIWGVWEYLGLFAIVLLHEFGHAFACRQTGGVADQIMLWPLGGAAFVNPPPRPGAHLWSLAAGPLVNVALFPIFTILVLAARAAGLAETNHDAYLFLQALWGINIGLLVFNLLPIYPLDGGQIVRSLLWFWLGPIRSLRVATVLGLIGAVGVGLLAFKVGSWWLGILAFFIFTQAQSGWRYAQAIQLQADEAERLRAQALAAGAVKPAGPTV